MPLPRSLVAAGLILLLSGGLCLFIPFELVVVHSQTSYQVGPDLEDRLTVHDSQWNIHAVLKIGTNLI